MLGGTLKQATFDGDQDLGEFSFVFHTYMVILFRVAMLVMFAGSCPIVVAQPLRVMLIAIPRFII
jgi:hypothetical protein